jgi:SAM-dependent methyltransferase
VTELYRNIDRLLEQMKTDSLLILRSTVYPGMTNLVYIRVRARGRKIHVAFCPERIAEGNNIQANEKVALDLNPVTRLRTSSKVRVVEQDICQSWAVDSNSMDVVFSSNFFEHLPSKEALQHCFLEIHRVLRPGGKVIAMGPNIRFCYDEYWDFMDHYLALSDRSMVEALELAGFQMQAVVPRFLPYTMARKRPQSPALVRIYLSLPFAWRILGKQFLVIARKAHA